MTKDNSVLRISLLKGLFIMLSLDGRLGVTIAASQRRNHDEDKPKVKQDAKPKNWVAEWIETGKVPPGKEDFIKKVMGS